MSKEEMRRQMRQRWRERFDDPRYGARLAWLWRLLSLLLGPPIFWGLAWLTGESFTWGLTESIAIPIIFALHAQWFVTNLRDRL